MSLLSRILNRSFDFGILAVIVAAFVIVAAQRLPDVPVPNSDEAMTLQVPYEMLYRGKLAFPMYRYLGGNIENSWHSYTPLYFVALGGFMKTFGWGLAQGRAFNLITSVLLLLMTYLIARRMFGWPVGLMAVLFLISDPLFLARSRLVRSDMLAATFGLLAFYLYEIAAERDQKRYYVASGLAAGAGVMCHTNLLYMLAVIPLLMFVSSGWRIVRTTKPYLFASGALAVMAYEIVYDIIDYQNFLAQNRRDDIHFRVLEPFGWWQNLLAEPLRYLQWLDARGARIAPDITLLQVFLFMSAVAIIYLLGRWILRLRRGSALTDARSRLLIATVGIALFFGLVTQRKVTQYVVYLAPWFALCAGVLVRDAIAGIRRLRDRPAAWARPVYNATITATALIFVCYGYALISQSRSYWDAVHKPDHPSFAEIKSALRSIVPEDVCPVSISSAYLWLVFPEYDQCYFAYMEARDDELLDLAGKEYALMVKPKHENRLRNVTGAGFEKYHLLAELEGTAYGSLSVYYTGSSPRLLTLAPKRFSFGLKGSDEVEE